ncbi:MAG: transposase, partial [Solirubrobacterales bacterium]|nr:transposase [Solirubrobacterales bacterium]
DDDIVILERRHRQRARVEDRIRDDKDTGLAKLPFKEFALNQAWLAIVLLAHDRIVGPRRCCWTASSPRPSPSGFATGRCTSPAASHSPDGAPSSTSNAPGPGPPSSPPRSRS